MARNGNTLYLVSVKATEPGIFLVEAKSRASALAHVAKSAVEITIPGSSDLVALGARGIKVETAAASEAE